MWSSLDVDNYIIWWWQVQENPSYVVQYVVNIYGNIANLRV